MYFFFLCGQKEKYQKKEAADQNRQALLRLPMTARQIRFAQTPLFPVIGNLRIRSLTGRRVRNGRDREPSLLICHLSAKKKIYAIANNTFTEQKICSIRETISHRADSILYYIYILFNRNQFILSCP